MFNKTFQPHTAGGISKTCLGGVYTALMLLSVLCNVYVVSAVAGDSVRMFRSSDARNGTFSSPNYPDGYPQGVNVRYVFLGRDKERVQITFVDIDLHYAQEESSFAVELV